MPGRPTNEPTNYFAVGKQSAKDTEATTFHFLKHLSGTGVEVQQNVQFEREGGDGQETGLVYKDTVSADGQAVANARPELLGRLFAWACGQDAVVAGGSQYPTASGLTQYHTSAPVASMPYLTVEQFWADVVERVPNVQITQLEIDMEAGRPWKVTPQFVSGGTPYSPTAAQTPTRETGQPFFYPGGTYVLDGSGTAKLTKAKVTLKRQVDDTIRTTSVHREDVVPLAIEVDIEGTLKYEDKSQAKYGLFAYDGGSQIQLRVPTGAFSADTQFGSGTQVRAAGFDLPCFAYTGVRVNKLDPDGKVMMADFTGMSVKAGTYPFVGRVLTASGGAF